MEIIIVTLLVVFFIGVIYTRISVNYIKAKMHFPSAARKKQQIQGKVCLLFKKKIFFGKTKIFLQFENKMTGEIETIKCKAFIGCGKEAETNISFGMRYSGRVICTIEKIRVYDWLGITWKTVSPATKANILVMPELVDCEMEEIISLQNSVEGMRLIPDKSGYDYSEPVGVREYQPGDSMKSIHWKLTGRMDRLFVKEASTPVEESMVVFVETIHENVPDAAACDKLASRLLSVCTWLLEQSISYKVTWYSKEKEQLTEIAVESADDIRRVLHKFMGCRQEQGGTPGKAFYENFKNSGDVYYITSFKG